MLLSEQAEITWNNRLVLDKDPVTDEGGKGDCDTGGLGTKEYAINSGFGPGIVPGIQGSCLGFY